MNEADAIIANATFNTSVDANLFRASISRCGQVELKKILHSHGMAIEIAEELFKGNFLEMGDGNLIRDDSFEGAHTHNYEIELCDQRNLVALRELDRIIYLAKNFATKDGAEKTLKEWCENWSMICHLKNGCDDLIRIIKVLPDGILYFAKPA